VRHPENSGRVPALAPRARTRSRISALTPRTHARDAQPPRAHAQVAPHPHQRVTSSTKSPHVYYLVNRGVSFHRLYLLSPNRLSLIRGVFTLTPPCEAGTSRSGNVADQLQSLAEGEFMASLTGLASIVSELKVVRTSLVNELRHVDAALSVLGKLSGGRSYTTGRRTLSASARKRISLAQKARWAKRAANHKAGKVRPKRTMSASPRARWAKLKAAKKK